MEKENLDKDNITACIQISTDGAVTVGETRGRYRDIICLLGLVILNLHEETGIDLEGIGNDLNKAVKEIQKRDEEGRKCGSNT